MAPNQNQPRADRGTPKGGRWKSPQLAEQSAPSVLGHAEISAEVLVTISPDMPMSVTDRRGREIPVAMSDLYVADSPISPIPPLGYLPDGRSIQMCEGGLTAGQLDALGPKKRKGLARVLPVTSGGERPSTPRRHSTTPVSENRRLPEALASVGHHGRQPIESAIETLYRGDALLDAHVDEIEKCGADMANSPETGREGRRLVLFARMVRSSSMAAKPDSGVTKAEARAVRSRITPDGAVSDPETARHGPPPRPRSGNECGTC